MNQKLLTTFIAPYGRFCFNKLPFGISIAPEIFQRRINEVLHGLLGVLCHIDDVLVYNKDAVEHETRLHATLKRIKEAGITLNENKCQFYKSQTIFLGHVINQHGISPDPKKTTVILNMTAPTSVTKLRRFMGNQMNKFSPNIAQVSKPLRDLLSSKATWARTHLQDKAFHKLKEEICSPRVLALYDVSAKTKVSANASVRGLGAVLLQEQQHTWRPVAFALRALTDRSMLCPNRKGGSSLDLGFGKILRIWEKSLDTLPPCVLRFRLRLMRFKYTIHRVPEQLIRYQEPQLMMEMPSPEEIEVFEKSQLLCQLILTDYIATV